MLPIRRTILGAAVLAACASARALAQAPPPPPPGPPPAPAMSVASEEATVSPGSTLDVSVFYGSLAPYGEWIELPPYGWVWTPSNVAPDWRPYTTGHWVWSDDFGWTWVADEPWGWAPFHYGRWLYDESCGWAWVPGPVWGPAWVGWRHGGGYTGWAPLPPTVGWSVGVGLEFGNFDVATGCPDFCWCFCPVGQFTHPRLREVLEVPARNVTIIHQTTVVKNIVVEKGHAVNRGLAVEEVEKAAKKPVQHVVIHDAEGPGAARATSATGSEIALYRPALKDGVDPRARPTFGPQGAPPSDAELRARTERETAELREFQERRMQDLQRDHDQEVGRADAKRRQDLAERHAAEMRAMREEEERERRVMQQRQNRQRDGRQRP